MKEKEDRRAALLRSKLKQYDQRWHHLNFVFPKGADAAIASDDSEELGWDLDDYETGLL